jgi:hypothetical protein
MGSEHSGQLMLTRDSEISILRYCCKQSRHERCVQHKSSGKNSLEHSARHRGHSQFSDMGHLRDLLGTRSSDWEVLDVSEGLSDSYRAVGGGDQTR